MAWVADLGLSKRMLISYPVVVLLSRSERLSINLILNGDNMKSITMIKATDDADAHYLDSDGNEVEAKHVITLGTGKATQRFDTRGHVSKDAEGKRVCDAEMVEVQNGKGKLAARKICALVKEIDRRVKNLLGNPDQVLTAEEREVLANFITGTANMATDKLEGVKADNSLPF